MPRQHKQAKLAVAGMIGVGAAVVAGVVIPIAQKRWTATHSPGCHRFTGDCGPEELDRWVNEGGCCAQNPKTGK